MNYSAKNGTNLNFLLSKFDDYGGIAYSKIAKQQLYDIIHFND